jgi:hypothetical protein
MHGSTFRAFPVGLAASNRVTIIGDMNNLQKGVWFLHSTK